MYATFFVQSSRREPLSVLVGLSSASISMTNSMKPFKKLKLDQQCDPVILLYGIHPKDTKTLIKKAIYIPLFIASMFTIGKIWKLSKNQMTIYVCVCLYISQLSTIVVCMYQNFLIHLSVIYRHTMK